MLKRIAAVILFLLPLELYAQVGPGPVPYRGVNNWNLIFGTDNTYDIGASGATRPRTGYFGTSVVTPALTVSGLTSGRVPFASTGGVLADAAGLTWDGTILGATRFQAAAGSSSNPSIRMTDNDTGFSEVSAANWGWYRDGTERIRLGSGGTVGTTGGIALGPSISVPDVTLLRHAAGVMSMGNGASIRALLGGGAPVASATALPVPAAGLYHVTGATTITSITSTNIGTGTCITLIFDGALTLTNGSNLVIGTDFVTTANDTWHGCYDGTSWFELSRKAN